MFNVVKCEVITVVFAEGSSMLECYAVLLDEQFPIFKRILVPLSSVACSMIRIS